MPKSATCNNHAYQNGSVLDRLPDCVKAHVVQYLTLDDVLYQGEVTLEGNLIPEDMLFQYIKWTDFEEPIRYIFKDFESVNDDRRLQRLEGFMKSEDFMSHISWRFSLLDFTLAYDGYVGHLLFNSDFPCPFLDELLVNWIKEREDSPAKEYVLSKLGNKVEIFQILERGRWMDKYIPTLPPVFIDVLGRLITKGDQESVLLFDQLLSNPCLKKYFTYDVARSVFSACIVQISETGGQPNILLKDEVIKTLRPTYLSYSGSGGSIICAAISHDRFDILDGILKKFEAYDFYEVFDRIFYEILRPAFGDTENDCKKDPEDDYKLAKDLLQSNIDAIRNAPKFPEPNYGDISNYGMSLPDNLLEGILFARPTLPIQSLFFFTMELFESNGIHVSIEEALRWSIHDVYTDYLYTCLRNAKLQENNDARIAS